MSEKPIMFNNPSQSKGRFLFLSSDSFLMWETKQMSENLDISVQRKISFSSSSSLLQQPWFFCAWQSLRLKSLSIDLESIGPRFK